MSFQGGGKAGEEGSPCERSHRRNLSVAKGSKAVYPSGHPMSHSTHVGFSCPPLPAPIFWASPMLAADFFSICQCPVPPHRPGVRGVGHDAVAAIAPRFFDAWLPPRFRYLCSEAVGVGKRAAFTSSAKTFPPVPGFRLPGFPALGVGHIWTAVWRFGAPFLPGCQLAPVPQPAHGVGHLWTAAVRPGLPALSCWFGLPCAASPAVGVGHSCTSRERPTLPSVPLRVSFRGIPDRVW